MNDDHSEQADGPAAPPTKRPTIEVIAEVVTYDPIRRHGFMKSLSPTLTGRMHFVFPALPRALGVRLKEAARPVLNNRRRSKLSPEEFKAVMRAVRCIIEGCRLRVAVARDAQGRPFVVSSRALDDHPTAEK